MQGEKQYHHQVLCHWCAKHMVYLIVMKISCGIYLWKKVYSSYLI